ncbi:hypothetical protein PISMIDRAFT_300828 [Pisolithus microcarpus 441]|uniref:Nucleoporin NSP1-like C-terminal domain-containing protein n=1 Tax=Pisolithus microcarpus 441 TaxID=765257 RepID=A0A0D0A827_9AGAM|nr:hypothetical protein PISMIDRAFT_300828 [Pisolithus microcarpus 441]
MSIMYIFILNRCGAASPRTSIALAPPSVLKGKTIEIVNKWPSKLENHVREFNKFAADVAVWPSGVHRLNSTPAGCAIQLHSDSGERTDRYRADP